MADLSLGSGTPGVGQRRGVLAFRPRHQMTWISCSGAPGHGLPPAAPERRLEINLAKILSFV